MCAFKCIHRNAKRLCVKHYCVSTIDETLLKALEDIGRSELNQHLLEEKNIFEERSGEVDSHDVSGRHRFYF